MDDEKVMKKSLDIRQHADMLVDPEGKYDALTGEDRRFLWHYLLFDLSDARIKRAALLEAWQRKQELNPHRELTPVDVLFIAKVTGRTMREVEETIGGLNGIKVTPAS